MTGLLRMLNSATILVFLINNCRRLEGKVDACYCMYHRGVYNYLSIKYRNASNDVVHLLAN